MPKTEMVVRFNCDTVGELLDKLAEIAKDPALNAVMDAAIEGYSDVFDGFKITRKILSDKSEVLDFELTRIE